MKRHRQQIRIIDHEPLSGSSDRRTATGNQALAAPKNDAPFRIGGRKSDSFGYPRKSGAVTEDFFASRTVAEQNGTSGAPMAVKDLSTSVPLTRTIAAVVSVFTLAITIPSGFIAMTESVEQAAIDPVITASIGAEAGSGHLAVSDVSMTRIMKSGSTVVTVFGEIRNISRASQVPGDVVIQLQDANGNIVQSWQHRTGASSIKPDGKLRFMTSSIDVSGRARSVIAFARPLAKPDSTTR